MLEKALSRASASFVRCEQARDLHNPSSSSPVSLVWHVLICEPFQANLEKGSGGFESFRILASQRPGLRFPWSSASYRLG